MKSETIVIYHDLLKPTAMEEWWSFKEKRNVELNHALATDIESGFLAPND